MIRSSARGLLESPPSLRTPFKAADDIWRLLVAEAT